MKNNYFIPLLSILVLIGPANVSTFAQPIDKDNTPIEFYGKVVDQHGNPVPDAKIVAEVRTDHFKEYRSDKKNVLLGTDQAGNFDLIGAYGSALSLNITKEGYELSSKAERGYLYLPNGRSPNPENRMIFHMWKLEGKAVLNGSSWQGKVTCDGDTNRFDLLKGSRSSDGELEIACIRKPLNFERTSDQPYEYKIIIRIVGGGIQPTDDEFTYVARDAGYMPEITLGKEPGQPGWQGWVRQEFYIKTAEGDYGRLWIEWDAGHRPAPTMLSWNCSVNPSGSRNLER